MDHCVLTGRCSTGSPRSTAADAIPGPWATGCPPPNCMRCAATRPGHRGAGSWIARQHDTGSAEPGTTTSDRPCAPGHGSRGGLRKSDCGDGRFRGVLVTHERPRLSRSGGKRVPAGRYAGQARGICELAAATGPGRSPSGWRRDSSPGSASTARASPRIQQAMTVGRAGPSRPEVLETGRALGGAYAMR